MKVYCQLLDEVDLQTKLNQLSPSTFTVARDKLSDGTRPIFYQYDNTVSQDLVAQAQEQVRLLEKSYFDRIKTRLLGLIEQVAAKSKLRKPLCVYSETNKQEITNWLNDSQSCPICVQARAVVKGISEHEAAQQILQIYQNSQSYESRVDEILAQAQLSIINSNSTDQCKTDYQSACDQLYILENSSYDLQ